MLNIHTVLQSRKSKYMCLRSLNSMLKSALKYYKYMDFTWEQEASVFSAFVIFYPKWKNQEFFQTILLSYKKMQSKTTTDFILFKKKKLR